MVRRVGWKDSVIGSKGSEYSRYGPDKKTIVYRDKHTGVITKHIGNREIRIGVKKPVHRAWAMKIKKKRRGA